MPPLIRLEHLEAAMEKAADKAQVGELGALKLLVIALNAQEEFTLRQCVENRIAAGEKPKRIGAPRSIQSASEKAAEDIHKLELCKCRRARSPSQIVESLLTLSRNATAFNRSLLSYIALPANRALSESLLVQEEELQAKFEQFLSRWRRVSSPVFRHAETTDAARVDDSAPAVPAQSLHTEQLASHNHQNQKPHRRTHDNTNK